MKIKKAKLVKIIREELQREGILDWLSGEDKPVSLMRTLYDDFPILKQFEDKKRTHILVHSLGEANFLSAMENDKLLCVRILRMYEDRSIPENVARKAFAHVSINRQDEAMRVIKQHLAKRR